MTPAAARPLAGLDLQRQRQVPDVDIAVLISRWLHIAAAIVAVGGAAHLLFGLRPAADATLTEEVRQRLREALRKRWAPFVHGSIAVLLVTGAFNFVRLALPPKIEPMPYHALFGLKFVAALLVFFIATALVGRSAGLEAMRRHAGRWLAVLLALAGLIVLMSGVLGQLRFEAARRAPAVTAPASER